MKHPTPSQATDVLTGDEEQNGKQKRTKRKKQRASPQSSYPGHSVTSYDAQGSYGEPILFTPSQPTGEVKFKYNFIYIYLFIKLSPLPATAGSARIMPRNELQ